MAAIGGGGDKTPRSGGRAQRGKADGQGAAADLAGARRSRAMSSSAIRESPEES
jgi:hypothetical protein